MLIVDVFPHRGKIITRLYTPTIFKHKYFSCEISNNWNVGYIFQYLLISSFHPQHAYRYLANLHLSVHTCAAPRINGSTWPHALTAQAN